MSRASPLEIQMALHFVTRPTPYAEHEPEHRHSAAVRRVLENFLARGFIERANPMEQSSVYRTEYVATEGLRVWTEALCAVPKPKRVERWEIPT